MNIKKIGVASDHAAFYYKAEVIKFLENLGYFVADFGIKENVPVRDYKMVQDLAIAVKSGVVERGIVMCGTGIAVSIAANKVKGIRAALCNELYSARMSREHNDSNILAFGSRIVGLGLAFEIVKTWIGTEFEGGRHIERNDYLDYLEDNFNIG